MQYIKKLTGSCVGVALLISSVWATEAGRVYNIQDLAGGARYMGMGRASGVLAGDPNGLFLNPAYLAPIQNLSLTFMYGSFLTDIEYLQGSAAVAFGPGTLGLGYLHSMAGFIPETIFNNGQIYQVGTYSAGDRVFLGSYAVSLLRHAIPLVQAINLGVSAKYYQQFVSSTYKSGLGVDIGVQADLKLTPRSVLSGLSGGIAYINVLPPTLTGGLGLSNAVTSGLRLSMNWAFWQNLLLAGLDIYNNRLYWGLEYTLVDQLKLRLGNDDGTYVAGVGLALDDAAGIFEDSPMSFSFDYVYRFLKDDALKNDYAHFWGLTLQGRQDRSRMQLFFSSGERYIREPSIVLRGQSARYRPVRVFNNGLPVGEVIANDLGYFDIKLNLEKDANHIYFQAYEPGMEILSERSAEMVVVLDQQKPSFRFHFKQRSDHTLAVVLEGNEALQSGYLRVSTGASTLPLEKLPDSALLMASLSLSENRGALEFSAWVEDLAGNRSDMLTSQYEAVDLKPEHGTLVYRMPLMVKGTVPVGVETVILNNAKLILGSGGAFETEVSWERYGKYALNLETIAKNGEQRELTHTVLYVPVLRDVIDHPQREVFERLAALNVFPVSADGLLQPAKLLTRAEAFLWLAKAEDIEPKPQRRSPFLDVPSDHPLYGYLPVLIDEGWLGAGDQTRFMPEALLTRSQAIELMVRASWQAPDPAQSLVFRDVSATSPLAGYVAKALQLGIISPAEQFMPGREVSRAEFLLMLAKLPEVKKRLYP